MTKSTSLVPALFLALSGCGASNTDGRDGGPGGPKDLTFVFPEQDLGGDEDGGGGDPGPCGNFSPQCTEIGLGPQNGKTFPLPTDMPPDPNVGAEGVSRDKNGFIGLDSTSATFDFVYAANTGDWGKGTVSKFNSKTVRELARYFTTTCYSHKTGSKNACDGMNGCCARDSYPQFLKRQMGMNQGPHEQIHQSSNDPSRTTVDFNGDLWVANRAFSGQSSVTKIANDLADCIDRNGNGKIDTSRDTNGDGLIQTDCNVDGIPDDIGNVNNKPCNNGMPQEFFGGDDECVLFTTNTNVRMQYGRPLTLGPGAMDFGPSDAWPGTYNDGKFFRIDGATGITKAEVKLPNGCRPYGAVVDSSSVLWTGNLGPGLCFFNTKNVMETGTARQPNFGQSGYGIALDRDQNIWLSSGSAYRYTPDRSMGFQKLNQGFWTAVTSPGQQSGGGSGLGVAADSRNNNAYFVYTCGGSTVNQIPASAIALPMGADKMVNGAAYPAVRVAGSSKGCGVSVDQNVFSVSQGTPVITRVKVDAMGVMTAPDILSAPMGNNKCPGGDRCDFKDANASNPSPYTYSDFTGFGLRNFTRPTGFYTYTTRGCADDIETKWLRVEFDADVPLNTSITVKARSGKTPQPDQTWGAWTPDFKMSPADLITGMPLLPNESKDAQYMQIKFDFATMEKAVTPKLRSFKIVFDCAGGIG